MSIVRAAATQVEINELAPRLRLAVMRLARALRINADAGVLTASQVSALATIAKRGPLTLGELAAAEGVQPPSITRVVANLEGDGLVERDVDPDDRRVTRVRVTARGSQVLERSRARKNAFLRAGLEDLSPAELAAIARALSALERLAGS